MGPVRAAPRHAAVHYALSRRTLLGCAASIAVWQILRVGALTTVSQAETPSPAPRADHAASTWRPSARAVAPLTVAVPLGGPLTSLNEQVHATLEAAARRLTAADAFGSGHRIALLPLDSPPPGDTPSPAQWTPLELLLASGAPPDLVACTSLPAPGSLPSETALAAARGWFLPLDSRETTAAVASLHSAAVDTCRDRGALLALPLTADPLVIPCSAAALHTAGIDATRAQRGAWTWDDLLRLQRCGPHGASSSGTTPPASPTSSTTPAPPAPPCRPIMDRYGGAALLSLIWQSGGHVVTPDGRSSLLLETAARAAAFFAALHAPGTAFSPASPATAISSSEAPTPHCALPSVPFTYAALGETVPPVERDPEWLIASLPRERHAAVPVAVTATLSVTHAGSNHAVSVHAAALLAATVAAALPLGAARLLDPSHLRRSPAHHSLAHARVLTLPDTLTTFRVHAQLGRLAALLRSGTDPTDHTLELVHASLQDVLDRRLEAPLRDAAGPH